MKKCLVVDDSSVIRSISRRILEGLDFQIVEAEDGEKALDICKRAMPEAIRLDWNMPIMDGYEFLGNLRRMPGGDQPKVVFCTTENDVAHIARAARRRQRIHHEAVRQGYRHREVSAGRFDRKYGAGVLGSKCASGVRSRHEQ
jgi:two-component system chemotaxis response regulator CheY